MTSHQPLVRYRTHAPGDTVLEGLEKDAWEGRKDLRVDPQPVPPWEHRKLGRFAGVNTVLAE